MNSTFMPLKIYIMRVSLPNHQSNNGLSSKIVKFIEGKEYLEILIAVIAISGSLVILWG